MIFLALVPSPSYVAIRCRELLPRGFTLTLSGGLFSVTAFIKLLPSVLSTAGCPIQSGLSSDAAASEESVYPQSPMATAPRGMRSSQSSDRRPIVLSSFLQKTRTRSRRLMPSWWYQNPLHYNLSDRSVLPIQFVSFVWFAACGLSAFSRLRPGRDG